MGLERTPAAEVIQLTAAVWLETVTHNRVWDQELDAPRFRRAFASLCQQRTSWPPPSALLEAMPPRDQLALAKQPIKASQAAVDKACAELAKVLGTPKRQKAETGHGHVRPRKDGLKARCGGPGICGTCALEAAQERAA